MTVLLVIGVVCLVVVGGIIGYVALNENWDKPGE